MPRSISFALPTPIALTSTPNDGGRSLDGTKLASRGGIRRIPKQPPPRVTLGAISLSSSSHFTLMPSSLEVKPVALPARVRQTIDNARADRIGDQDEHDRNGGALPAASP